MEKRSRLLSSVRTGAVYVLLATAGCTATVGGDHKSGGSTDGGPTDGPTKPPFMPTADQPCDPDASLAPARVWRLTDEEYVNVVRSVFGVIMPPEVSQAQVNTGDFSNLSEGVMVSDPIALSYQKVAHQAAQQAVTSHLDRFLPCGSQNPSDACVEGFIRNRVSRAFGRPVTAEEVQGLMGVYKTAGPDGASTGIRLIIEAALQSGSFLYRSELGPLKDGGPTAKVALTPYEVASALSFATVDSAPDDELWDAAQSGKLTTPAGVAAQVERLLALPEAQAHLSHTAGFWLGIERLQIAQKSLTLFPEFTDVVQQDLYKSGQLFVQDLFTHGTVKDLLSSKRLYVNESLAKLYGIAGVTGSGFMPVDSPLAERSGGILTQPGVMAATDQRPDRGDVIHRGLFIYRSLVCGASIGTPPANATAVDAGLAPNATERDRANFRATAPQGCGACHGMFDAFGLATERYDPIGRYTPAVDSTAVISDRLGPALAGPVAGLPELISKLQQGRMVSDCAAANLGQMTLGRQVQADLSCAVQGVKDKFASSGSFIDFYRALLTSPGFVTRDPVAAQ
jgi:Protein of unknown function (DUF1592)/Protein of unknown function (DUF1588)/Protein of unknown function (DUF1595)/Protein of unknown function (DUF1587)